MPCRWFPAPTARATYRCSRGHTADHEGAINANVEAFDSFDPTFQILSGKIPPASDINSVLVNEPFVKEFGLRTGDSVVAQTFSQADLGAVTQGIYHPTGPTYSFHIVGVVRTPDDVALDRIDAVKQSAYGSTNTMFIPFEWYEKHHAEQLSFPPGYEIALRSPGDRAAFDAAVRRTNPDLLYQPARFSERPASFSTPVDFETGVLLALGITIAAAGMIVVGLLLRAEQRSHRHDEPILRGLGVTPVGIGAVAALRTAPIACS